MDWLHVYIAGAAFLVFALVGLVMVVSSQQFKVDLNKGIFTWLKYIYANILKPHEKGADGQQGALESFYKTQVCETD
jgi:betaine lipid synthase